MPKSEDEQVTLNIILQNKLENIIHVTDAKNVRRVLFIALQLTEAGLPFVMALNMDDEERTRGITIDKKEISRILGVDVISTIATQKKGIKELCKSISQKKTSAFKTEYDAELENAIEEVVKIIPDSHISKRFLCLLLLAEDPSVKKTYCR
ncbi:MAG: FeoB small GTPase domain-containing protein [bacterium]